MSESINEKTSEDELEVPDQNNEDSVSTFHSPGEKIWLECCEKWKDNETNPIVKCFTCQM